MGFTSQRFSKLLMSEAGVVKSFSGFTLVSIGILLATSGGSWDISNHLLNKPETFFAPPHAVLYSGVAIAIVGTIVSYLSRKKHDSGWHLKLVVVGIALLATAGPIDFSWHSMFGLDGLLSPPHFVLVLGMVLSSLGALAATPRVYRSRLTIALAILPLWLALSAMLYMFSLPFSKTNYLDFNPNPDFAAVLASIGFPFIISLM